MEEEMNEGKDIRITSISVCSPSVVVKVTLTNDVHQKQLHGFIPCETSWNSKINMDVIFLCFGRLTAIHMNLSGILFNCQQLPRLIL
jgi:hypothetical protein